MYRSNRSSRVVREWPRLKFSSRRHLPKDCEVVCFITNTALGITDSWNLPRKFLEYLKPFKESSLAGWGWVFTWTKHGSCTPRMGTHIADIHAHKQKQISTSFSLTLWRPLLPYGYNYLYKASCVSRVKPSSAIFDTLTLRDERQSARMSKITWCDNYNMWQEWASKG